MELGKPKLDKRTLLISFIAFFVGLSIVLSVICGMLFVELRRVQNLNGRGSSLIINPDTQTDIDKVIANIETIMSKYSVIEHDEDYKSQVINGYLAYSGDRYAYYYTGEEWAKETAEDSGNSYGIGVTVAWTGTTLQIVHVMEVSPAKEAGIQEGDELISVNGTLFEGLSYYDAVSLCRGEKGDERKFVIKRGEEELTVTVICDDYTINSVFYSVKEYKGKKIGVIECTQFIRPTPNEIKNAIGNLKSENCTGIIFDMRGNPGGLLTSVVDTLDLLLGEGPVVYITYKDKTQTETFSSDKNSISDLPYVILADENTASAGELFTSCMRDFERATIIGTTTFGKGCGQNTYPLSDGGFVKLTTFYYSPPKTENYDGVGIVPDIEVKLPEEYEGKSPSLVPEDQDTQMLAALDFLTK